MRWPWREVEVEEEDPDETDLPLNNDEATAIFNLLESADRATQLGHKDIVKMCLREARYILKRGQEEPAPLKALKPPDPA